VCNPVQYFFSIIGNATLWTTLFAVYAGASISLSTTWAGLLMLSAFLIRIVSALILQKRITGRTDHFRWWFLPPIKDILAVGVWAAAFLGNTVQWRGHRYRVNKGGRLTELQQR
jgi:hypothetical protein